MRIHLFVAPNGNIVSFSASLLDKTSNPIWNCWCVVFGACYIKYTSLCSLLPLSGIVIFRLLFYLWWSQKLHLNLYKLWRHMLLCSSAAVSRNLSSSSILLICNPLVITALMEKFMQTLLLFLFLAWVFFSLFLDVMASSRWVFALAFGSIRRGIKSTRQLWPCSCCYNVPCALRHHGSVSVKVMLFPERSGRPLF